MQTDFINQNSLFRRLALRTDVALAILACLSTFIIVAPQAWFSQTLEFDPRDYRSFIAADEITGGNSEVAWIDEAQRIWHCKSGNIDPSYCSAISNVTNQNGKGFDLSNFQTMTLWIDYIGNAKSLRIYLRNASQPYYVEGDASTTKYNQIEVPVDKLVGRLKVDMDTFGVANWWLAQKKVPLKYAHPEFNNITYIEVQTGSGDFSGQPIQLRKIEWQGIYLSDESIFKGLVLFWSALIIFILFVRLLKLKFQLIKDKQNQLELMEVNKLLELQNKEFFDLAKTDQLTGISNRIGMRDVLYENLRDWKEERIPTSLILIDLDHFKQINDIYGHDVGDEVLKTTADFLSANIRRSDCLARWGGEEFVLICHDSDLYRSQMIAEHLREKLQNAEIHPQIKITASFGVASLSKADIDDLFKRADQALYDAKKQGRNKVCVNADIQFGIAG